MEVQRTWLMMVKRQAGAGAAAQIFQLKWPVIRNYKFPTIGDGLSRI